MESAGLTDSKTKQKTTQDVTPPNLNSTLSSMFMGNKIDQMAQPKESKAKNAYISLNNQSFPKIWQSAFSS